jgi:hypothetical protein
MSYLLKWISNFSIIFKCGRHWCNSLYLVLCANSYSYVVWTLLPPYWFHWHERKIPLHLVRKQFTQLFCLLLVFHEPVAPELPVLIEKYIADSWAVSRLLDWIPQRWNSDSVFIVLWSQRKNDVSHSHSQQFHILHSLLLFWNTGAKNWSPHSSHFGGDTHDHGTMITLLSSAAFLYTLFSVWLCVLVVQSFWWLHRIPALLLFCLTWPCPLLWAPQLFSAPTIIKTVFNHFM